MNKHKLLVLFIFIVFLSSCLPDGVKKKMDSALKDEIQMVADAEFKKAVANIELHKVRFGEYPESLKDLKFLSQMDSSLQNSVEYVKLDSGYELNLKSSYSSFDGQTNSPVQINYPNEFWEGTGCVRSNLMAIKPIKDKSPLKDNQ
jgi:hypothetical protein